MNVLWSALGKLAIGCLLVNTLGCTCYSLEREYSLIHGNKSMSYGTITAQTKTYSERAEGVYVLDTLNFGDPADEFRLRPGSRTKAGDYTFGVTRYVQVDVSVGGQTVRKSATVTLSVSIPDTGVTATKIDSLATDIAEFITPTTVSEMLQGKS